MVGSKCNLKTHVRNLEYPSPYKSGAPKAPFWTTSQLTATLTAYIFGTKYDIDNRSSALQTTRNLIYRLKTTWTWSTNGFKLDRSFYPLSVNSAFHFIARLRRRRSANGTQPNFAKRWTVGRSNNTPYRKVGVVSPKKNWGPKDFYICLVFRQQTNTANT